MGISGCSECDNIIDDRLVKKVERLYNCKGCGLEKCKDHYGQLRCEECREPIDKCDACVRCCEGCGGVRYCEDCFDVSYHDEYKMYFCDGCTDQL